MHFAFSNISITTSRCCHLNFRSGTWWYGDMIITCRSRKSFTSLFAHFAFDSNKRKHDFYRGEDYMTKFCAYLGKQVIETTILKKKKQHRWPKKRENSFAHNSLSHMKKEIYDDNHNENYCKVWHRGAARRIRNLRYKTPIKIPVVLHNV